MKILGSHVLSLFRQSLVVLLQYFKDKLPRGTKNNPLISSSNTSYPTNGKQRIKKNDFLNAKHKAWNLEGNYWFWVLGLANLTKTLSLDSSVLYINTIIRFILENQMHVSLFKSTLLSLLKLIKVWKIPIS